jgi:hypothetical protein
MADWTYHEMWEAWEYETAEMLIRLFWINDPCGKTTGRYCGKIAGLVSPLIPSCDLKATTLEDGKREIIALAREWLNARLDELPKED